MIRAAGNLSHTNSEDTVKGCDPRPPPFTVSSAFYIEPHPGKVIACRSVYILTDNHTALPPHASGNILPPPHIPWPDRMPASQPPSVPIYTAYLLPSPSPTDLPYETASFRSLLPAYPQTRADWSGPGTVPGFRTVLTRQTRIPYEHRRKTHPIPLRQSPPYS